jgi:methionine synthase II (cobalamin-independent)
LRQHDNPNIPIERGPARANFAGLPYVEGKITSNPVHPEYAAFSYLKSVTPDGIIPKVIIPSPLFLTIIRNKDDPFPKNAYSNKEDFYKDISQAYRETILRFYELGARVCFIVLIIFFLS